MHNKRTVIGLIIFALVASSLVLFQTTNFFGQGLVFTPGSEIEIDGPTEINQSECLEFRDTTISETQRVPIHTNCNAAEFEIGSGTQDLSNVAVLIKNADSDSIVALYREFQTVMSRGQIDSITWDGVTCGSELCIPGNYYIEVFANDGEDSARFEFIVLNDENTVELQTPLDEAVNINVNPIFSWDPHPEAIQYGLVISESEDLSSPIASIEGILTDSTTLSSAETLEPNTTYYWTIYAASTVGSSRYPQTFEFTTAPITTTLTCTLSADEGTTSNPFIPGEEIARFVYNSSIPAGAATNYSFAIKDASGTVVTSTGDTRKITWPGTETHIDWDGTDDDGNSISSGTYTAELYLASLETDQITVKEECRATVDVSLANRQGIEIEVEGNVLKLGEHFEITTKIPFKYTKKIINVYDLNDNLLDTVAYACASGESCPIKSTSSKFDEDVSETIYYDGIRANGEPLKQGLRVKFKLWVKPVRGSTSVDFSRVVNIDGNIKSVDCEFRDVQKNSPDYRAVQYVCEKGLFEGYPDKTMGLNERLTRAQLMVVAGRLGEQTGVCSELRTHNSRIDYTRRFKDLSFNTINDARNQWKLDALQFTANCGIIKGYSDGTIQLDKLMTHAEWWKVVLMSGKIFASSENFDPWFLEYERYLLRLGINPPNGLNRIDRGDAINLLYSIRNQLKI